MGEAIHRQIFLYETKYLISKLYNGFPANSRYHRARYTLSPVSRKYNLYLNRINCDKINEGDTYKTNRD